jgi:hypothetical protein
LAISTKPRTLQGRPTTLRRVAEFAVSVHTGLRLTEQYWRSWSRVHLDPNNRAHQDQERIGTDGSREF